MRLISIRILTYGSYEIGLRLSSVRFLFLKKAEAGDVLRDWGIPFLGEDVEEFEESSKDEFPYQYRLLLKVFLLFLESLLVGSRSIVTGLRHELEVIRENVKVPSQLDTDYSFFEGNRQLFFSQLLKAREMHTPKRFDSIFLQFNLFTYG